MVSLSGLLEAERKMRAWVQVGYPGGDSGSAERGCGSELEKRGRPIRCSKEKSPGHLQVPLGSPAEPRRMAMGDRIGPGGRAPQRPRLQGLKEAPGVSAPQAWAGCARSRGPLQGLGLSCLGTCVLHLCCLVCCIGQPGEEWTEGPANTTSVVAILLEFLHEYTHGREDIYSTQSQAAKNWTKWFTFYDKFI